MCRPFLSGPGNVEEKERWFPWRLTVNRAFRMTKEGISVILIRSSYDPDPYPELGRHTWAFSLALVDPLSWENSELSV